MKKILLFAITVAALALSGAAFYKTRNLGQESLAEAKSTETVAYLSDLDRRIAMFIVPVNYTTNGPWCGFELKASTNDFCHGRMNEIPERVFMQYFMDSDVADVGGEFNEQCPRDRAKLYICNEWRDDQGLEARSYTRIANTLDMRYDPSNVMIRGDWVDTRHDLEFGQARRRHIEEVVVLVDACDLVRYPEELDCDDAWLTCLNQNLMWVYGRKGRAFWEEAHGSKPMWRPIAPVRWFKEMPNWAQLADEEYYLHHPEEAPVVPVPDHNDIPDEQP